jgi:uncharacterized membrane protein YsdA (DUF1294 family)/cold shock CspA family protein
MKTEALRYTGTLQSWNDDKGFGFIKPNTEGKDVFIHIKDFTYRNARPKIGDVLNYQLIQDNSGKFRAMDAQIHWDGNTAHSSSGLSWLVGNLRSWDDDKGYGFIVPKDGGRDIFVHIADFKHDDYRPVVGGTIYYRVKRDDNGKLKAYDAMVKEDEYKTIKKKVSLTIWLIVLIPFILSAYAIFAFKNPAPAMVYSLMSFIAFFMYAYDKNKAKADDWRIAEKTLHIIEFLGGWPGALLAQRELHHKNKKESYQITFWFIVAIHLTGWAYLIISKATFEKIISDFIFFARHVSS